MIWKKKLQYLFNSYIIFFQITMIKKIQYKLILGNQKK